MRNKNRNSADIELITGTVNIIIIFTLVFTAGSNFKL